MSRYRRLPALKSFSVGVGWRVDRTRVPPVVDRGNLPRAPADAAEAPSARTAGSFSERSCADLLAELSQATVDVTNFHAFIRVEKTDASRLTKRMLARRGEASEFQETPQQMVNRVCRSFGGRRSGIVVINDEAHHCYRKKASEVVEEKLTADEKREAEHEAKTAEVWLSGLEAVKAKLGVKAVYDLSATPFFLKGSGYCPVTGRVSRRP